MRKMFTSVAILLGTFGLLFWHMPQVKAATGVIAQSQIVSITGGYNTTTQMYEQTGEQTVITNWSFSAQQTAYLNANNPPYAQCSVSPQEVTCTSDACTNSQCSGRVLFTGTITISSQQGNPTIIFSLPSSDPSNMTPMGIFVVPETTDYGSGGNGEESYLRPGQSGGWTYNFSNVTDPQNWNMLMEFLSYPIVAAIAVPTIQTIPVYGWVTTTVWHPVQISYS
ncbi:hypothetical protein [Alicyclobacillus sendaiensis]|uniref:Uncharacterized protein n=1 Tax=Alicyclobacillus sendaiensis PA2 TaxID=3029425 RepID=A0ABT6Y137_ALISE|nr:hypothetical protein [Alicyclobacillus sendaiensis]MDI9261051.1 hypothetical protein [Alicyclobacillus sendaiensis PA2]